MSSRDWRRARLKGKPAISIKDEKRQPAFKRASGFMKWANRTGKIKAATVEQRRSRRVLADGTAIGEIVIGGDGKLRAYVGGHRVGVYAAIQDAEKAIRRKAKPPAV